MRKSISSNQLSSDKKKQQELESLISDYTANQEKVV